MMSLIPEIFYTVVHFIDKNFVRYFCLAIVPSPRDTLFPSRSGHRFENSLLWRGNQTVYNYSMGVPIIVMHTKKIKITTKKEKF
jgi:hypothetical protein